MDSSRFYETYLTITIHQQLVADNSATRNSLFLDDLYIFRTISRPGENQIHKTPTWNDPKNIFNPATFLVTGTTARD